MKFKKEWLQKLAYEDNDKDEVKIVKNEVYDTSRWSIHYELIFEFKGKYYRTYYSTGATEQQCEEPFEYEEDNIECEEVVPVIKNITVYETKNKNNKN